MRGARADWWAAPRPWWGLAELLLARGCCALLFVSWAAATTLAAASLLARRHPSFVELARSAACLACHRHASPPHRAPLLAGEAAARQWHRQPQCSLLVAVLFFFKLAARACFVLVLLLLNSQAIRTEDSSSCPLVLTTANKQAAAKY